MSLLVSVIRGRDVENVPNRILSFAFKRIYFHHQNPNQPLSFLSLTFFPCLKLYHPATATEVSQTCIRVPGLHSFPTIHFIHGSNDSMDKCS